MSRPLISERGSGSRTLAVHAMVPASMKRESTWRLEEYLLVREIYKGKSIIFEAYCRTSKSRGVEMKVALKVYKKKHVMSCPVLKHHVESEISNHIALNHENIIMLYAAFEDDKNVYLVEDYADGDLYSIYRKGVRLQERSVALYVILPLLKSLDHLHSSKRIIHRDIKPENCVIMASTSQLKLADFGLSIHQAEERPVTRCGTLGYMSPEVLRCPDKSHPSENKSHPGYGSGVDIWATGVMAFELLSGTHPFPCSDDILLHIDHVNSESSLTLPQDMSSNAKSFIALCLAKSPGDRPSARSLAEHPFIKAHLEAASHSSACSVNSSSQPQSGTDHGTEIANMVYDSSLYALSELSNLADRAATISNCSN